MNVSNTRNATLRSMLNKAAFIVGYRQAKEGKPFDPDWGDTINNQWYYERGRLFAQLYDDKIKINRKVSYRAINTMQHAVLDRSII
jgi:hypothetical protein